MTRTPHPVRGAYDYAITDRPCPTCGSEPFAWCVQSGGIPRHVPCVARLTKPDTPQRDAY